MSYVILAEFRVRPKHLASYLDNMRHHAELSGAEPGCHLFEVAQDASDATRVVLYERYSDATAYASHRATPHYARFLQWAPPMLEPKDGQVFQRRSVLTKI
jgi:(4S)-4-hydroxy-5-phosphonooxypentane-2,3-dione isomerase